MLHLKGPNLNRLPLPPPLLLALSLSRCTQGFAHAAVPRQSACEQAVPQYHTTKARTMRKALR